jgi:hypothetical protein
VILNVQHCSDLARCSSFSLQMTKHSHTATHTDAQCVSTNVTLRCNRHMHEQGYMCENVSMSLPHMSFLFFAASSAFFASRFISNSCCLRVLAASRSDWCCGEHEQRHEANHNSEKKNRAQKCNIGPTEHRRKKKKEKKKD